jgi:hypothetical protein
MKRFTAQYVFTNNGPPLKRALITVEDDGTISSVTDNAGELAEVHSTEFHNGIIIPGSDLRIFEELKALQSKFPDTALENHIREASVNVLMMTGKSIQPVKIEPGSKPGLLLLQDLDLQKMKLLPESFVIRLI